MQHYGCPKCITLDRDPRWVGAPAPAGSDFPSALLRFAACLGIEVRVCEPHHPQQNGFVERYHRTYQQQCLALDRPANLEQARQVTQTFMQHYHFQRPKQALSCGNRPPRTAFATLPQLPCLPKQVEADGWLKALDGLYEEGKIRKYDPTSPTDLLIGFLRWMLENAPMLQEEERARFQQTCVQWLCNALLPDAHTLTASS